MEKSWQKKLQQKISKNEKTESEEDRNVDNL